MKNQFMRLVEHGQTLIQGGEMLTLNFSAETTHFVRFNHARLRQAGRVSQAYLDVQLIDGERHVSCQLALNHSEDDFTELAQTLIELRAALRQMDGDPYLLINRSDASSEHIEASQLPSAEQVCTDILQACEGLDMVGILAIGELCFGFANSLGQRNWQQSASYNFDYSLYAQGDKAVKRGLAGSAWSQAALAAQLHEARGQLSRLSLPARKLSPGSYRAYFTPAALSELMSMLNWGGFSEKELRTKRSPLLKLASGEQGFSNMLNLFEHSAAGLASSFSQAGFAKPAKVDLIRDGGHCGSMISPRTAQEYGLVSNGAGDAEDTQSLEMAAGSLALSDVLQALGTGIYVANLWYLNFSDRAACRITGMTRFACFWVENGEIVAPLEVMRFDDSLFRLLGSELEDLTAERELLVDAGSYESRSTASMHLPGALVASFNLTL